MRSLLPLRRRRHSRRHPVVQQGPPAPTSSCLGCLSLCIYRQLVCIHLWRREGEEGREGSEQIDDQAHELGNERARSLARGKHTWGGKKQTHARRQTRRRLVCPRRRRFRVFFYVSRRCSRSASAASASKATTPFFFSLFLPNKPKVVVLPSNEISCPRETSRGAAVMQRAKTRPRDSIKKNPPQTTPPPLPKTAPNAACPTAPSAAAPPTIPASSSALRASRLSSSWGTATSFKALVSSNSRWLTTT